MANGMIGAGAYLGVIAETTEGTPETVTAFAPLRNSTLNREIQRDNPEPMVFAPSSDALPTQRFTFIVSDNAGGDVSKTLYYDGAVDMLMLQHFFGSVASGGSGPYTWTYGLTIAQPTKPSLTIEVCHGQSGPAAAEVFAGCRLSRMELDVSVGQPAVLTFGVIAQTSGGPATPTTPTYESSNIVLHNHATNFTFNSVQYSDITSAKLVLDKKIERTPQLGQLTTGAPQVAGPLEGTIEVRTRWTTNTAYAALLAGTAAAGALTLTDGTRSAVFTFGRLQVMKVDKGVSGPGFQEVTISFKLLGVNSNPGAVLVLTNGVAP